MARGESRAVLLRRGPTEWVQLILWNTANDRLEYGQWFHGRIYERRCDLSPDGRLFVYFASKFTGKTIQDREYTYAWTAVSHPPYFTALALWPKGDCWHGGGLFNNNRTLTLNHRPEQAEPHPKHLPQRLKVTPNPHAHGEDIPIYYDRLVRDGWTCRQQLETTYRWRDGWTTIQPGVWEKTSRRGSPTLIMKEAGINFQTYGGPWILEFTVRTDSATLPLAGENVERITWADWDQQGRLVCAADGRLYSVKVGETSLTPYLIDDLNLQTPQQVAPSPEAQQW